MKKLFAFGQLFVLLCIANNSFADADHWCRKNCYGDVRPRYKTHAKVIQCGHWGWGSYDNHHSCNVNVSSYIDHYSSYYGILDAWAWAKTGPSWYPGGTHQHSKPFNGWCSGMNTATVMTDYSEAPYMMPGENEEYDPNVYYNNSEITVDNIGFNENTHTVDLTGINAYLDINSPNMPDDYNVVMITVYQDDYVSVDDPWVDDATGEVKLPILWQSKAFMYNGQLVLEGDFMPGEFAEVAGVQGSRYQAANLNKVVSIPPNVNLDNVIVEVSTDGGSIALGVPQKFAISGSGQKTVTSIANSINNTIAVGMTVTPNPATDDISVNFYNKKAGKYKLAVVDLDGRVVKELGTGMLDAGKHEVNTYSVKDLANGVYFVVYTTEKGEKFSKKLIKQ